MPREDFYAGLTLAQQVQKLADHHSDPKVRHISQYEDGILNRAVARLHEPITAKQAEEEFDDVWRLLTQIYSTTVVSRSGDRELLVISLPLRSGRSTLSGEQLISDFDTIGTGVASPRTAQIALNLLVRHEQDPAADLISLWSTLMARRSPPLDPSLTAEDYEFVNRVLYQPTVAIEQSPPVFVSASAVLAQSDPTSAWVSALIDEVGNPLVVASSLGMILVFKLLKGPVDGLSAGLRERLYRWARPPSED